MEAQPVRIPIDNGREVSGLFIRPPEAQAIFVFAHGAGANMAHAFMEELAQALALRSVATLRFNFPFMDGAAGRTWGRPDAPEVAHAAVRAAASLARILAPELTLFVGGKSFGARMTSQSQAQTPVEGARGLLFVGFPLHLAKKPSITRAHHLKDVRVPMLFVQGTRDALADLALMQDVCASHPLATLHVVEGADHGFAVLVRSGRTHAQVIAEIADAISAWMKA